MRFLKKNRSKETVRYGSIGSATDLKKLVEKDKKRTNSSQKLTQLQSKLANKRFDSLPRLRSTEELDDDNDYVKPGVDSAFFGTKRSSDIQVGPGKLSTN